MSGFSFAFCRGFARRTRCVCATPFPGREFFAEPHRGVALCGAQETCADAARAHKRGGHQGFHPSYESPRFLLASAYQRTETMGERPYCSSSVGAANGRPFLNRRCSSCFLTATQIGDSTLGAAQGELPEGQERVPWGITVPHESLVWRL